MSSYQLIQSPEAQHTIIFLNSVLQALQSLIIFVTLHLVLDIHKKIKA